MELDKLPLGLTCVVLIRASVAIAQEKLGQVRFPVSGSAAAQQELDRTAALLHSFWFDASAKAFAAVTRMDPGCGMGPGWTSASAP